MLWDEYDHRDRNKVAIVYPVAWIYLDLHGAVAESTDTPMSNRLCRETFHVLLMSGFSALIFADLIFSARLFDWRISLRGC